MMILQFHLKVLLVFLILQNASSLPHYESEPRELEETNILQQFPDLAERDDILNKAFQTISFGVIIITNFMKPIDLSPMFAISLAKIPQYVRYTNLSLPNSVRERINLIPDPVSFSFIFGMPDDLKINSTDSTAHSSYIANQWNFTITICAILILRGMIFLAETAARKAFKNKLLIIIQRLKTIMSWSLGFIVFFTNYDSITLFAITEFQNLILNSFLGILSFILCLFVTLVAFYSFLKLPFVCNKIMKKKADSRQGQRNQAILAKKSNEPYRIIFLGYKNDTWLQQSYFVFHLLRVILCSAIIACFPEYPIIQILWFSILNVAMIHYILTNRPFRQKFSMIVTIVFEASILIMNLCCLSLLFCNTFSISECPAQEEIGYSILILKSAVDICSHAFIYVNFGFTVRSVSHKAKLLAAEKKLTMENLWEALDESSSLEKDVKEHVNPLPLPTKKLSKSQIKPQKDISHPKIIIRYSAETDSNLLSTENQIITDPNLLLNKVEASKISIDTDTEGDTASLTSIHLNNTPQYRDSKFQRKMYFSQMKNKNSPRGSILHQRNPTIIEEPSQFEDHKASVFKC